MKKWHWGELVAATLALAIGCGDSGGGAVGGGEAGAAGDPGAGGAGGPGGGGTGGDLGAGGVGGDALPRDPEAQAVEATVSCGLPYGLGDAAVELELSIDPRSAWVDEGSSTVDIQAQTVIPARLGDLLLELGTRTVMVSELEVELLVEGAEPNRLRLELEEQTYDVDPDGDGMANEVVITIPGLSETVSNDGSAFVDFTVEHFVVTVVGVPLVSQLTLSDTKPPASTGRSCGLSSSSARFPVAGAGGNAGTAGAGGSGPSNGGETFDSSITCPFDGLVAEVLGTGEVSVDLEVSIDPQMQWVDRGSSAVDVRAETVIPASLGDVLLGLGEENLTVSSLRAELSVGGGEPTTLIVELEDQVYDLDADDDEQAEDIEIILSIPTTTIANDGSPALSFEVDSFVVVVEVPSVALVSPLTLTSEDVDQPKTFVCDLVSGQAVFAVAE